MTSFLIKIFVKNRKNSRRGKHEKVEYNRADYDATFIIPKKILRWVTIKITHELTPFARKCWNCFYWFEFANMMMGFVLEFLSMVETARGGSFEDAVKIFRMLPCWGMVLLAMVKSSKMIHHRPVYENLINEVGDMWPNGTVTDEEQAIIEKARNQLVFVIKGYYWCNNALLISFLWPPVYEFIKRQLGYENQMILHFFYWFPFDCYQPVYIDIILVVQTWQALIVIWSNLCGDLLFCAYLSHITTQLDLLSLRIQKLVYVPVDKQLIDSYPLSMYNRNESRTRIKNEIELEKKQQKELAEIILRHRDLIRLSGDVESMFTFALLVNFFNSSIIICFCGFCSVVVEKWNEAAYKSFLITALSQTFFICWYGQKLLDSSKGVSHALYNSGWYMTSRNVKSSIFIMIHRAQKQICITTYGFSVICLGSYTNIIKTAWSYFTLILNTYKQ